MFITKIQLKTFNDVINYYFNYLFQVCNRVDITDCRSGLIVRNVIEKYM